MSEYACVCVYACMCVCVCVYVCMRVCIYTYIYTHRHTYIDSLMNKSVQKNSIYLKCKYPLLDIALNGFKRYLVVGLYFDKCFRFAETSTE